MGNNVIDQKIRLVFESIGAEKVKKQLEKISTDGGLFDRRATKRLSNLSESTGIDKDTLRRSTMFTQETEAQAAHFRESRKEAQRFKGEYLGLMFAGMALQRTFGGLTKNLISTYKELSGEAVTPLSKSLTRLEANWKFLKFSIVEASTPMIMSLSDTLSNMAIAISKMNPKTLQLIFSSIAGLAGIGSIMSIFGQGAIFFSSIAAGKASKSTLQALESLHGLDAGTLSKGTSFMSSMKAMAGKTVAIGFSVKDATEAFADFNADEYASSLGNALSSAAGFSAVAGKSKAANYLAIASIGAQLVSLAEGGTFSSVANDIGDTLISVGAIKSAMGGSPWTLTIGVVLKLLPEGSIEGLVESIQNTFSAGKDIFKGKGGFLDILTAGVPMIGDEGSLTTIHNYKSATQETFEKVKNTNLEFEKTIGNVNNHLSPGVKLFNDTVMETSLTKAKSLNEELSKDITKRVKIEYDREDSPELSSSVNTNVM